MKMLPAHLRYATNLRKGPIDRAIHGVGAGILSAALLLVLPVANAANKTWDGGGANDNWNTAGNWNGDANPANTDDVFLGSAFGSGTTISLNGATRTVNSFNIDTSTGFTISANQLTITSGAITRSAASSGVQTLASSVSMSAAGTWNINGAGSLTVSGSMLGSSNLTKTGTGTLILSGVNTGWTPTTNTVNSGILTLDYATNNSEKLGGAALVLGGGTVNLTGGNTTENTNDVTLNAGHSTVTRAANTSILQLDAITRNVGSTLNLGAASIATTDNTLTGGILGGWFTISGTTWATSGGANNSPVTALATYHTGNVQTAWTGSNVSLSANPTTNVTTKAINSLRFTNSSTVTITAANALTLTTGGLMSTGSATALITGGTLTIAGAATDLIVHQNSSNDLTINSIIANTTGADGLTKSGTGRLVLGGANTYTGQNYINQGILSVSANNNLGAPATGAAINLNGGTLQATASFALNNGGANHRPITLAANGGTVDVTGTNTLTVTGTISGAGSITKTGSGTLTTSAANTYTGATTIVAGTFFIDGAQTAAVGAVNVNGGKLGGNGTVGGLTTVANNAILAPGQSIGKLTFNAGLNLSAVDAKTQIEISGTSRGVVGGYDAIDIAAAGTLTFGGDLTFNMDAAIAEGVYDIFAFTLAPTGDFNSISFAGTGPYSGSFNKVGDVWTAISGDQLFTFDEVTGNLTVVPEPGVMALVGLGAMTMLMRNKRRKAA